MRPSVDLVIGLGLGFLLGMALFARWRGGLGISPISCLMELVLGLLLIGLGLAMLVLGGYVELRL